MIHFKCVKCGELELNEKQKRVDSLKWPICEKCFNSIETIKINDYGLDRRKFINEMCNTAKVGIICENFTLEPKTEGIFLGLHGETSITLKKDDIKALIGTFQRWLTDKNINEQMNIMKKKNLFIHIKSGKLYKIIDNTFAKVGKDWKEAILYSPIKENNHSKTYTRLKKDFEKKFIEIDLDETNLIKSMFQDKIDKPNF